MQLQKLFIIELFPQKALNSPISKSNSSGTNNPFSSTLTLLLSKQFHSVCSSPPTLPNAIPTACEDTSRGLHKWKLMKWDLRVSYFSEPTGKCGCFGTLNKYNHGKDLWLPWGSKYTNKVVECASECKVSTQTVSATWQAICVIEAEAQAQDNPIKVNRLVAIFIWNTIQSVCYFLKCIRCTLPILENLLKSFSFISY